jgi:hypothetical protein
MAMSEVLRTFRRKDGGQRGRHIRRLTPVRRALLVLLGLLLVWTLWTTRNTYRMGELIPRDQAYRVYAGNLLDNREGIARSQVWALAPKGSAADRLRTQLTADLGMPKWVVNNLVNGGCHVSGSDVSEFKDAVLVTEMTRIGCIVEKFHRVIPGIVEDFAGGLGLRAAADGKVFYAVRGRVLLVSLSRSALVHALTLTPAEATPNAALVESMRDMSAEDVSGEIRFPEDHPIGQVLESARFAMRLSGDTVRLGFRVALRPAWREQCAGLLENVKPCELRQPPDGLLVVSANFSKPLSQVWTGIDATLSGVVSLQDLLKNALGGLGDNAKTVMTLALPLLDQVGPGLRLCWHGIDQNEMVPMPEFAAAFDAKADALKPLLAMIPTVPVTTPPDVMKPRFDEAKGVYYLPLIGGPSMTPALGLHDHELVVSTSRDVAERLIAAPDTAENVQQPGNFYVRVRPQPTLQALLDSALQFAQFGAVRGYTPETLQKTAAPWLATAAQIDEIAALAAHENGELRVDFKLVMAKK